MLFEYDQSKSIANKTKHGIDFIDAQKLWQDFYMLELRAKTNDEPRYLAIGLIDNKHWSAIYTYRNETIRLISVRRARPEEIAHYEG